MTDTKTLEVAVLKTFARLEAADSNGAWNCFYPDIIAAAGGSFEFADQVCRELRRQKLLKGEGRGQMASYYLTDKGKDKAAA